MKTREKILFASLALFNEEGEPNVTTVDIAAEIDISPGNLYYHFKGKSTIILELYESFEVELVDILNTPLAELSVEDSWIYMYVLFERIYAFRFFYQNQHDILQRIPEIEPRFRRLLNRKFKTALALIEYFRNAEVLSISEDMSELLAESMVMLQTHWLSYIQLRSGEAPEDLMFHRAVFQCVSLIAPYLTARHQSTFDEFQQLYASRVAGVSA